MKFILKQLCLVGALVLVFTPQIAKADDFVRYEPDDIEVFSNESEKADESRIKVGRHEDGISRYLGKLRINKKDNIDVDVEDAQLIVRGTTADFNGVSLELVQVISSWEINTVDGFNGLNTGSRLVIGEKRILSEFQGTTTFEMSFDVTDMLEDWIEGANNGFMIRARNQNAEAVELFSANRVLGVPYVESLQDSRNLNNNTGGNTDSSNQFDPNNVDFVITEVKPTQTIQKGQDYNGNISIKIKNQGQSPLFYRNVLMQLFVYEAGTQRFLNGAVQFINGDLSSQEEVTVLFTPGHFSPGLNLKDINQVEFIAQVDVNDAVNELQENNNERNSGIIVLQTSATTSSFCSDQLERFVTSPTFANFTNNAVAQNLTLETQVASRYLVNLKKGLITSNLTDTFMKYFVTYGCDRNTTLLGEGERAAVLASYREAFGALPKNLTQMSDIVLIANGRYPKELSLAAENKARVSFIKIYKREPNLNNSFDKNAISVFAYGLRQVPENRNLASESQALLTFKGIYGFIPQSTIDWNLVQGIAYSGASR